MVFSPDFWTESTVSFHQQITLRMLSFLTCLSGWWSRNPLWRDVFFVQFKWGGWEKNSHHQGGASMDCCSKKRQLLPVLGLSVFLLRYSLEISRFGLQQKPLDPGIPQTQWKSKPSGFPVKKMEGKSKLRQMLLGKYSKEVPVKKWCMNFGLVWYWYNEVSVSKGMKFVFFFHPEKGNRFCPIKVLGWDTLRRYPKGDPTSKKRFMPSLGAIFIFGQTFLTLENTKYKGLRWGSP